MGKTKYYTSTYLSNILGVTVATINNWINSGDLPGFRTLGGHYRIPQDSLISFLNEKNIPIPTELKSTNYPRILIVEDDLDAREFLIDVINELDYFVETEVAVDGFSAGSKVSSFKPDFVILDIMLPGINGFKVCRQIKNDFKEIKILAITGYYNEENKRRILEAGADIFMRKPIELDELKKTIDKFILSKTEKYIIKLKKGKEENKERKTTKQ